MFSFTKKRKAAGRTADGSLAGIYCEEGISPQNTLAGHNDNTIIFGGGGSADKFHYVIPHILRADRSYIVADMSGGVYRNCMPYLRHIGYDIRTMDTVNPENGNSYNPFEYIYDSRDIEFLGDTVIDTADRKSPWKEPGACLIKALIGYIRSGRKEERNFPSVLRAIDTVLDSGRDTAEALEKTFGRFSSLYHDSFAAGKYREFKKLAAGNEKEAVCLCRDALQIFEDPCVKNMTETDSIHLETAGDRKTALFVITSPQCRHSDYILGKMILFQSMRTMIKCRAETAENGGGNHYPAVPVKIFLDSLDWFGRFPEFADMLESLTKRSVSVSTRLYTVTPFINSYKDEWKDIINRHDTAVFASYYAYMDSIIRDYYLLIRSMFLKNCRKSIGDKEILPEEEQIVIIRGICEYRCRKQSLLSDPGWHTALLIAEKYYGNESGT